MAEEKKDDVRSERFVSQPGDFKIDNSGAKSKKLLEDTETDARKSPKQTHVHIHRD